MLEGLGVTFPENGAVFAGYSNNLEVDKVIAINNLKHAWGFIHSHTDCDSDYKLLCQINRLVGGANLIYDCGYLRKISVRIGGTSWSPDLPCENEIKKSLNGVLINNTRTYTDKAVELMLYTMHLQAYIDGNKKLLCYL